MFHSMLPDNYDVELNNIALLLLRDDTISVELCPFGFVISCVFSDK